MRTRKINALVIGAGYVGERHVKAQLRLGNRVGVYDISAEKARHLATSLNLTVFATVEEAISWADLVHICTPDHLHTEFAEKCMKAGKPVLCEKPVTTSLDDALYLHTLSEAHKTLFFIGNNNRLTPTFMEMKKRVKRGELGKPIALYATYLHDMRSFFRKTPWRLKQNFLYGGAVHALDLVLWIMGEKVVSVYAQTGRKLIKKYSLPEDYHITLTFESGVVATIWANARVVLPVHKADLQIYLENGTLLASNKSAIFKSYKYRKGMKESVKEYKNEQLKAKYRYTIPKEIEIVNKYITKRSKYHDPVPRIDDVIPLMKILDAIERSINKQKIIFFIGLFF